MKLLSAVFCVDGGKGPRGGRHAVAEFYGRRAAQRQGAPFPAGVEGVAVRTGNEERMFIVYLI